MTITITKEELAKMYNDESPINLCKRWGISTTTLYKLLRQSNIPFRGGQGQQKIRVIG